MANVKVRALHLCDSLQRDARGLPTLRGIYPPVIMFPIQPWYQKFVLFLAFDRDEDKDVEIEIRVTAPNVKSGGKVFVEAGSHYFDLHLSFGILIPNEGDLKLDWKADGGRWQKGPRWNFDFIEEPKELSPEEDDAIKAFFKHRVKVHDILERYELSLYQVGYSS